MERYGGELAIAAGEVNDKFKALSPPDALEPDFDASIKVGEDQLGDARAYVDAGKAKSAGEVRAILAEFRTTNAEATRLARRIGFKVCGGS